MNDTVRRIKSMRLKADGAFVRGARDSYHVATISSGMNDREDYARLFAASPDLLESLRLLSEGISVMRRRGVIDEVNDIEWCDQTLARAREAIGAAMTPAS